MAGLGDDNHPLGRAAVVPQTLDGAVHKADCYRIEIDSRRADPQFVAWALSFGPARDQAPLLARGSTRARLSTIVVRDLPIPALSLQRQRDVVATAESLRSLGSSLLLQCEVLKLRLAEYRDALITEAVTGQLDVTKVSDAQMDERLHAVAEGAEPTGTSASPER